LLIKTRDYIPFRVRTIEVYEASIKKLIGAMRNSSGNMKGMHSCSKSIGYPRPTANRKCTSIIWRRTFSLLITIGPVRYTSIMSWFAMTLPDIAQDMSEANIIEPVLDLPQGNQRRAQAQHGQWHTTPASRDLTIHRPIMMKTKRLRVGGKISLILREWSRVVRQTTPLSSLNNRNRQQNRLSSEGIKRKSKSERPLFPKTRTLLMTLRRMTMSSTNTFSPVLN
jgi:hypothetical protein